MSVSEIIRALEQQKEKLEQAIALLNGGQPKFRRGRRKMSQEASARIGAAQVKRWKAIRKAEKAKAA